MSGSPHSPERFAMIDQNETNLSPNSVVNDDIEDDGSVDEDDEILRIHELAKGALRTLSTKRKKRLLKSLEQIIQKSHKGGPKAPKRVQKDLKK